MNKVPMENSMNAGEVRGPKTEGLWISIDKCLERHRSTIALLLLVAGEIVAVLCFHGYFPLSGGIAVDVVLLALLGVLFLMSLKTRRVKSNLPAIFTKLLSNAVVPRWLGVWYLLLFVMHFSWATDGAIGAITSPTPEAWWQFGIGTVGLIILLIFFPEGRSMKDESPCKVFVSGMSKLSVPKEDGYRQLNLRPLVRILQVVRDEEAPSCEMLILKSDQNTDPGPVLEFLGVDAKSTAAMPHDEKLKLLIRTVAKREFPGKKWIDELEINFTRACNYDDFPQCSGVLMPLIKGLDDSKHRLYFNLTPGTVVVSSLMTLLAIDANRELYYYNQKDGISDEDRLARVEKSQIPLRNLLTQALESQDVGQ